MTCRRRGFSLNEVLVTMTLSASLLMICMQLVHRVMREHTMASQGWATQREYQRLSTVFRDDAWAAAVVEVGRRAAQLKTSATQTVQYRVESNRIVRILADDRGQTLDEFTFPSGSRLQFSQPQTDRLQLIIRRPLDTPRPMRHRRYRILASIGRDHRLNSQDISSYSPNGDNRAAHY